MEVAGSTLIMLGFSVRRVEPADLIASLVWIYNWRSMLSCLIANRRLRTRSPSTPIMGFISHPKRLADIERQSTRGEPVLVRARRRSARCVRQAT
jgi:hypothetical protein